LASDTNCSIAILPAQHFPTQLSTFLTLTCTPKPQPSLDFALISLVSSGTGDEKYIADAKTYLAKAPPMDPEAPTFETGYKTPGVAILLAQIAKDAHALSEAQAFFKPYLDMELAHTKGGAAYPAHWGALRHVANLGFLGMVHAKNDALDNNYRNILRNYAMAQVRTGLSI